MQTQESISVDNNDTKFYSLQSFFNSYKQQDNLKEDLEVCNAVKKLEKLASRKGQTKAQILCSKLYVDGKFVAQDIEKANKFLNTEHLSAHEKNIDFNYCKAVISLHQGLDDGMDQLIVLSTIKQYAQASYILWLLHKDGYQPYIDANYEVAESYLKLASDQNHFDAQYEYATILEQKNQHDQAKFYLKNAARNGHSEAKAKIIDIKINQIREYLDKDTSKNKAKKYIEYLKQLAEKNHAQAQVELGKLYLKGTGIGPDRDEAVSLFKKSSAQGNCDALYELGCSMLGNENHNIGIDNLKKAAINNHAKANFKLGLMMLQGEEKFDQDARPINYFKIAADLGDANALYVCGCLYFYGVGVIHNIAEAESYFERAKKKNDIKSTYMLGKVCLSKGKNIEKNHKDAENYFKIAANSGWPEANFELAKLRLSSIKENESVNDFVKNEIINYLIKDAEKDHILAIFQLGKLYLTNRINAQNVQEAIKYFKKIIDLSRVCKNHKKQTEADITELFCQKVDGFTGKKYKNQAAAELTELVREKKLNETTEQYAEWLSYAVEVDTPNNEDLFALGCYYIDQQEEGDNETARLLFERAQKNGCQKSKVEIRMLSAINHSDKLSEEQVKVIEQYANQNNDRAKYYYGKLCLDNKIKDKKPIEGIPWIEKAADANHTLACILLGEEYLKGRYKNEENVIKLLEQAAKTNNRNAQYTLGLIFKARSDAEPNSTVSKIDPENSNLEQAVSWWIKAEQQNHVRAAFELGIFFEKSLEYNKISNKSLIEAEKKSYENRNKFLRDNAIKYLKKATEQNLLAAQYRLCYLYLSEGLINDHIECLKKLSENKDVNNLFEVGCIYESSKKYDEALKIFQDICIQIRSISTQDPQFIDKLYNKCAFLLLNKIPSSNKSNYGQIATEIISWTEKYPQETLHSYIRAALQVSSIGEEDKEQEGFKTIMDLSKKQYEPAIQQLILVMQNKFLVHFESHSNGGKNEQLMLDILEIFNKPANKNNTDVHQLQEKYRDYFDNARKNIPITIQPSGNVPDHSSKLRHQISASSTATGDASYRGTMENILNDGGNPIIPKFIKRN